MKERLAAVKEKIEQSARKAGRKPQDIQLVAVSKTKPIQELLAACACGQQLFGENYIQEVLEKRPRLPKEARIHFIGHLQSNKAKQAADFCDMVETVDSLKLAKKLSNHLENSARTLDILLQVNIGNDPGKSGIAAEEAEQLYEQIAALPRLHIAGLMTIPPFENTAEESRRYFAGLRQLGEKLCAKGLFPGGCELSMGMSQDFPVAIEEGATIVRVGTAIFGKREVKTKQ